MTSPKTSLRGLGAQRRQRTRSSDIYVTNLRYRTLDREQKIDPALGALERLELDGRFESRSRLVRGARGVGHTL